MALPLVPKIREDTGHIDPAVIPPSVVNQRLTGEIVMYGGVNAPSGWLKCDGAVVSRTTYAALFAAIGTAYGAGDGSTTFRLPDLRGRSPIGYNSSDSDFNALGKTGGEKAHTLTLSEMPTHTHGLGGAAGSTIVPATYNYNDIIGGGGIAMVNVRVGFSQISGTYINTSGGSGPHNNVQPYQVVHFIIKA